MFDSLRSEFAPSRPTTNEALMEKERLIDIFNRCSFFAYSRRKGFDPHGTTQIAILNYPEYSPIHLIKPCRIDMKASQGKVNKIRIKDLLTRVVGKISDST